MKISKSSRITLSLAIIIALIFAFGGCTKKEESTGPLSPYIGGTKGIVAEFEEIGLVSDTSKMNEVYENEKFDVELTLKNKGEYEVGPGEVFIKLQGINPDDFGLPHNATNTETIEKVKEYLPEGGETTVDFGEASYNVTGIFYDANFFAVYNYPYETKIAIPKVCFKGDIREKRICNIDEEKKVFSSGAPVVATKAVESSAATRRIRVTIDIENVGGGRAALTRDGFDNRYDEVYFEVNSPGWTCKSKSDNVARLSDGKGQIRCTYDQPLDENTLYEDQLDLTLKYFYEDITSTTVRIRESNSD